MRVVHINYDGAGWGGASIAMLRIHQQMKRQGYDSIIVCKTMAKACDTIALPFYPVRRIIEFWNKMWMKLCYGHVYRSGLINTGMAKFVNSLKPDKVVLHWFHVDTIGLQEIPQLHGDIEWWLHDLWPMSGTDPYPDSDWYKNGEPLGNRVSRRSWLLKKRVVECIKDRLTVVGPSEWVCNQARESLVFSGVRIIHMPYPVDEAFVSAARDARRTEQGKSQYSILFGAKGGTRNPLKGFDRLMAALQLLPEELNSQVRVDVFGEDGGDRVHGGIQVHFLGAITDTKELAQVYRNADVFAFPSRKETWGQVKSEALLCGVPVVAFNESACAEGIEHGVNGWIANEGDLESYAKGIEYFLTRNRVES